MGHRSYTDHVRVYESQYHVTDSAQSAGPPYRENDTGLVALSSGISVITGTNTGQIPIILELHDAAPPVPLQEWDEIVEVSYHTPLGDTHVRNWNGEAPPGLPAISHVGPGTYRVRVHARHRDDPRNHRPSTTVEEHLISVWPAPQAPTTVHKASDAFGARWRGGA